jgi:cephalosporin hydroxylase
MRVNAQELAWVAVTQHGASQIPDELAAALELVADASPVTLAEIGCDLGGTLWAWRQACPEARVYGITLNDNGPATGGQGNNRPLYTHGATIRLGDSHKLASRAWLARELAGDPLDVLVIDGDHSYNGVRRDYELYSPLVRVGGLVLIHDVVNAKDTRVDVPRFWRELARGFTIVSRVDSNPVGWGVINV